MSSAVTTVPCRSQMDAWRRQIGHRHRLADHRGPRPFAVVGYLVRGARPDQRYVELRQLCLFALFDERLETGALATRLVGVTGRHEPAGLVFGGPDLSKIDKDLRLAPAAEGHGARFDAADGTLLELALGFERYLERCARHPFFPRRRTPRLPDCGDGAANDSLVDLTMLPKRQVIVCESPRRDLVGTFGSTTFDLYHTRFHASR